MKLNIQPTIFKRTALAFALLFFFSTTGLSQTSVTDLYRLNDGRGHHFYTTDQNERRLLIQKGWSDEGVTTKCFSTSTPGTVKVERLFNPATGDHLYTTSEAEVTKAVTSLGFRIENLNCWIYPSQVAGSAPVYRLHAANDHFYTSSDSERQNAVQNLKYTQETMLGYGVAPPDGNVEKLPPPGSTQKPPPTVISNGMEKALLAKYRTPVLTREGRPITIETDENGEITSAQAVGSDGVVRLLRVTGTAPNRTLTFFENNFEILSEQTWYERATRTLHFTVWSKPRQVWLFHDFNVPWTRHPDGTPYIVIQGRYSCKITAQDHPNGDVNTPVRERWVEGNCFQDGRFTALSSSEDSFNAADLDVETLFKAELERMSAFVGLLEEEVNAYSIAVQQSGGSSGLVSYKFSWGKTLWNMGAWCIGGAIGGSAAPALGWALGCATGALSSFVADVGGAVFYPDSNNPSVAGPGSGSGSGSGSGTGAPSGTSSGDAAQPPAPPQTEKKAADDQGQKPKSPKR